MNRNVRRVITALSLTLLVLAACGCSRGSRRDSISVSHYPDFYDPGLQRVAVVPFASRAGIGDAGERIGEKITAELINNGTYQVHTPAQFDDALRDRDVTATGIIESDVAKRIGRLESAQALVCGVCNRYETVTTSETRYREVATDGMDDDDGDDDDGLEDDGDDDDGEDDDADDDDADDDDADDRPVRRSKEPYQWTRHDAYVECHVVVIDTVTGEQIAAVDEQAHARAQGSPPAHNAEEVLRSAEDDLVARVIESIAVTQTQIKLEGKVLQTAVDFHDPTWEFKRKFTPEAGEFYVVVRLPPEADRNAFKISIVSRDDDVVAAEQEFTWSRRREQHGYAFEVAPIVEGFGFGKYRAELHAGAEPIAHADFKIVDK